MERRRFAAPEFVIGEGALELVGQYANNLPAKKVLLVTELGVVRAGWAGKVKNSLTEAGVDCVVFSDVTPNPKDTEVMAGAALYLEEKCDALVAVGGGSPIDCAKGIGAVVVNNENILSFAGVDRVRIPGPPLISIPTTAGSSADVSQFAVITDSRRRAKIGIISRAVMPDLALIDPIATTTMPPILTAATGVATLAHAMEAYVSTASATVTDLIALEAVRLVANNLKNAVEHPLNMGYRSAVAEGSLLAGLAFSNTSLGLAQSMAHSLGGYLNLSHGLCNAYLLEHVVDYNFDSVPNRFARIAEVFGLQVVGLPISEQKNRLIGALKKFIAGIGISGTLRDLGVTPADLKILASQAANDPCLVTNPILPTLQDIEKLYERAL